MDQIQVIQRYRAFNAKDSRKKIQKMTPAIHFDFEVITFTLTFSLPETG